MKTNKFVLLFMVVVATLVYFFRQENFWFLIWFDVLLIVPNEIWGRFSIDSRRAGLLLMAYSVAFMISLVLMLTLHGIILLGMFFGLFFSVLLLTVFGGIAHES